MSKWIGGAQVYTIMELIADFGQALGPNNRCTCCNRACMYAIRYPDRDTLFVCRYCDTSREGV